MKNIELSQEEIRYLRAVLLNNRIINKKLLTNDSSPNSIETIQLSIDIGKRILEKLR